MSEVRKALIIGGDGRIGSALAGHLERSGITYVMTTRRLFRSPGSIVLDLAGEVAAWRPPTGVTEAYLLASVTSLEACRLDPALSRRVNVEGVATVAETLVRQGVRVVFCSTDRVFDGSVARRRAEEPLCPATEYGRQKADAEKRLYRLGDAVRIVRLTKVTGPDMALFEKWKNSWASGGSVGAFADMVLAPVPMAWTVDILTRIAVLPQGGIFQVSSSDELTYLDAARFLARKYGIDPARVHGVRASDELGPAEPLPRHSTLDVSRLREVLGIEAPASTAALECV